MKKYRIVEDVTGLFFIEIKSSKRVGFFRKKIDVWKVANKYGNISEASFLGATAKSYTSLSDAEDALRRFKNGNIIHVTDYK